MNIQPHNELFIERIFHAPRELVWKAWAEPDRFMKWWGPKHFTCPVCRMDFRVGGKYHVCMRSPEGQEFWITGVYREIIPMKRIVYTDSFSDEKGNVVHASEYGMTEEFPLELLVTLTFEDAEQGKTKFTLRHAGMPAGEMSDMASAGWNESLDKLDASLQ